MRRAESGRGSGAVGAYLKARRDVLQPEDVGLPREPGRRVRGLRRQEVAELAGISADYYLRLEQGRDHLPSEQVLRALGRALRLDRDAMGYLERLVRPLPFDPAGPGPLDDAIRRFLYGISAPAFVFDTHHDIVCSNPLARALGAGFMEPGNNTVLTMFAPGVRQTAPDWEVLARDTVASLRFHGDPRSPRFRELVDSLLESDADFRRLWARHDARPITTGATRNWIEGIGLVDLRFQNLEVPGRAGFTLTVFYADPGTPGVAALAYLTTRVRDGQPLERSPHLVDEVGRRG